jgi:serine/threonine protein kinase
MRWLADETIRRLQRLAEWPDLADTKYLLREELGRGGMGTVYLAEDTILGREVALKVAAAGDSGPETARRMLHEARIVARLEHPSIVPIHDVGTLPDGRVYYAMKRVNGRRLDEWAAQVSLPERLRSFQRICEAIAFAHAHGVIHRDLKPENVMVGPFGEVLVMDWGVAKIIDDDGGFAQSRSEPLAEMAPATTADGAVVGTVAYMAPEQAEGRRDAISRATDIYGLGAILYFLLTNQPPFETDAAARRVRGESRALPIAPRHLAPKVARPIEAVVMKAMAIVPGDRYASAEELAADTGRFIDRERVLAHRESPLERGGRFLARYRAPILLVLAYLFMRTVLIFLRRP